jgi:hypothetical protein
MRWLALPLLLAACVSVPSDTSTGDRAFAELTKGRTAGTPQRCIDISQSNGPQVIDAQRIAYHQSGRREWVSNLRAACPSLRQGVTLIVDVYGSQLCENDRFRTVSPGQSIPGAYCRFGKFTAFDKPRD